MKKHDFVDLASLLFDLDLNLPSLSLFPRPTDSPTTTIQGVSLPKDASQVRFRLVDAKDQVVGRLAAQLARILQGKDKPTFSPAAVDGSGTNGGSGGDVVVVKNAALAAFTGRKWDDKLYRWHSGRVERARCRSRSREGPDGTAAPGSLRNAPEKRAQGFAGEEAPCLCGGGAPSVRGR